MGLLSLPSDVHSMIWSVLRLQDLARLRQTCSYLSAAISADKRLWVGIFAEYVKAQSLRVPVNFQDVEQVDARGIESWVKHAVLLDRCYRTPEISLSTRKVNIREGLRVTWLRIILGRWCLVAAADEDMSLLSLWDILAGGSMWCAAEVFLDAPVIDGQIDCSKETVCALTVGTTLPYILVVGMYQSHHNAGLRELARMAGGAHVLFFRGNLVGFATRDGDDTYPYIWNWEAGELHCLRIPHGSSSDVCPLPVEACRAISVQDGFVVTLHHTMVHVFSASTDAGHPEYLGALEFAEPVAYGQFLNRASPGLRTGAEPTVIRILYQTITSDLQQATLQLSQGEGGHFSMEESDIEQPPNVLAFRFLHLLHVGSSGRTVFCGTSLTMRCWWSPSVLLALLHIPDGAESVSPLQVDGKYISISRKGLPLLHLLSDVDFDDGAGILLFGTTLGDVCVGTVLSESIITPRSLRTNLSDGTLLTGMKSNWDVPVPLVLPPFYNIRKKYRPFDRLVHDDIIQTISDWREPRVDILSVRGWSNDWIKHEHIWDWITPLSRWGPLDVSFMNVTVETRIRNRLQTLGDIVPVLFRLQNHNEVVFRIGQRMFYSRMRSPGEPEDDFELHEEGVLGVLPLTFDRFLDSPMEILGHLSDRSITSNLESRFSPKSLLQRMSVADMVYVILDYVERVYQKPGDVKAMLNWSNQEWDEYAYPALGLEYRECDRHFQEVLDLGFLHGNTFSPASSPRWT